MYKYINEHDRLGDKAATLGRELLARVCSLVSR
jgi:hypothetical protein